MKLKEIIFNRKTLVYFLVYMLYVPVFTLAFLYGPYSVDKKYGYDGAAMTYCSSFIPCSDAVLDKQRWALKDKYALQIKTGADFPEKERFLFLESYLTKHWDMHYAGFIAYYVGIALAACIVLFTGLGRFMKMEAFFVMLASLIAFAPVRFLYFLTPDPALLNPENKLSIRLDLPPYLVHIVLAILGVIISLFILRRLYKKGDLRYFLLGSLPGAIIGYFLWFRVLGPELLPHPFR